MEEGKRALYGIYGDANKAELKPESRPQLEQVAALLARAPKLNLDVGEHTDSVGTLEANVDVSRRPAQAVVAALAAEFKVAPTRLIAQGVSPLAPVGNNADQEGKAPNRRVELI